jgi:hypothetical protein
MIEKKQKQNEKEYSNWIELINNGRLYWNEIKASDDSGKKAHYEKEVDSEEHTITFIQKIFDNNGTLIEIHQKYPIDKGHITLS